MLSKKSYFYPLLNTVNTQYIFTKINNNLHIYNFILFSNIVNFFPNNNGKSHNCQQSKYPNKTKKVEGTIASVGAVPVVDGNDAVGEEEEIKKHSEDVDCVNLAGRQQQCFVLSEGVILLSKYKVCV